MARLTPRQPSLLYALALALLLADACAFVRNPTASHGARCGPVVCAEKEGKEPEEGNGKPKISIGGLFELVGMGMGAPMLGKLERVNFNDPERPDLEFSIEANRFMREDKAEYFEEGYVDDGRDTGPGFLENLLSGGRLQREYYANLRKKEGKK